MCCWQFAGILLVLDSDSASSSGGWAVAGLELAPLEVGTPDLLLLGQGSVDALLLHPPLGLFAGKKRDTK